MIRIREKEQQERRSRAARFSEESQQACVDYWQGVLAVIEPSGILEPEAKAPRKEDIRFKVGWPDFHLKAYFSRASPRAGVWLSCRGDNGFANYEALEAHRTEIERAIGGPLKWTADEDREKGSFFSSFPSFDANDKSDWPRQHKLIAEAVLRFYLAVQPFVEPLLQDESEKS